MKRAKKLVAGILAFAMVFGMSMTAFADGDSQQWTDAKTITITKSYVETNENTNSPAEDFTVVQVGNGVVTESEVTTAPAITNIAAAKFSEGDAAVGGARKQITITLPQYSAVGIYTYTLKEVAGNTAGVTYYGDTIKLVVTVINDTQKPNVLRIAAVHTEDKGEVKSDVYENTYSAGQLKVTKEVTGELGSKSKEFDFTVEFTAPTNKTVKSTITATKNGTAVSDFALNFVNGKATYSFKLADGQNFVFSNLPYGVTYKVTETAATGYTTTKTGDTGEINSASATAAFVNDKSTNPDMGIHLDSLPYILVFAGVVIIAAFAFIARKRRYLD